MSSEKHKPSPSRGSLIFRVVGLAVLVATIAFWLKTGAHTGFSKNRVEIPMVDPITQIEYIEYEDRFIMGLEYLAGGTSAGVVLFGMGYLLGRKR
ncbi:MAG: hypothetical protein AAF546_02580 [Verrucomicrobiota bacterium]